MGSWGNCDAEECGEGDGGWGEEGAGFHGHVLGQGECSDLICGFVRGLSGFLVFTSQAGADEWRRGFTALEGEWQIGPALAKQKKVFFFKRLEDTSNCQSLSYTVAWRPALRGGGTDLRRGF
jgi:hypothetical protein